MRHTFIIYNTCFIVFFFKFYFKSIISSIKIISKFEIERRNRFLLYFNDSFFHFRNLNYKKLRFFFYIFFSQFLKFIRIFLFNVRHTFIIYNTCFIVFFFKFYFKSIISSIKIISKFEIERRNRLLLYFNDSFLHFRKFEL